MYPQSVLRSKNCIQNSCKTAAADNKGREQKSTTVDNNSRQQMPLKTMEIVVIVVYLGPRLYIFDKCPTASSNDRIYALGLNQEMMLDVCPTNGF